MKILLVRVEATTRYMQAMYKVVRMEPLSLEYLGAAVKPHHDVKVVDMRLEGGWAGLRQVIQTYQPDVVGTGGDTCEANSCKKVLSLAKEIDPKVLTVMGGIHATTMPSDLLHPDIDLVCVNEGVFAFQEIIRERERGGSYQGIAGIGITSVVVAEGSMNPISSASSRAWSIARERRSSDPGPAGFCAAS